ncbi:MAG: biotin/lipoyl-containing protein [Thermodesulfobacteriota bacterium]|nr:biotin/lipoyl-containing protein [Thermodesulfobacteriota bacterium]
METINQDDVIQLLRMIEESKFDELHLKMGNLKLDINRFVKAEAGQDISPIEEIKEEDYLTIKAPMLGFYRSAPEHGAPLFVKAGQSVDKDDAVCLIEVMGQSNIVTAGVRGRIKKIYGKDGQMVEFKQPLFLVEEIDERGETKGGEN